MKIESTNKRANFRTALSNGFWVFKILYQRSPSTIIALVISRVIISITPTFTYYLLGILIDKVINLSLDEITTFQDLLSKTNIVQFLFGLACVLTLDRLFAYVNSYVGEKINTYYLPLIRLDIFKTIASLDVQKFETSETMDIIRKAQDNSWRISVVYGESISLFSRIVRTIVTGVIIFSLSPILGIITIVLSVPGTLIAVQFITGLWNFYNGTVERRRKGWWLQFRLSESRERAETYLTKSFRYIYNTAKEIWFDLLGKEMSIYSKRFRLDLLNLITVFLKFILLPLYLIGQLVIRVISVGQFSFYLQASNNFTGDIDSLMPEIISIWDNVGYISFIRKLYQMKPSLENGDFELKAKNPPSIEFKNVWFQYPKSNKMVLKNINFKIAPGKEIALVGENGVGKSTIIKLILRFYDVTKGEILINGLNIKKYDLESYYKSFGALFQDFDRFEELSVEQNIISGDYEKKVTKQSLEKAAELSDAIDFIKKYENGFDQTLDNAFEGGTKPSTGQWQKIALARMFYRNAPVLILDEPTASIDANAEFRIFKRIFETFKGKTLIIISHRFSTVRNAQKIYVIHDGEIVEEGSHEELITKNGRYKKAFDLQAKGYKS